MLGGTLTLIGTSTNILASAILKDDPTLGREMGMFEFSHLGLIQAASRLDLALRLRDDGIDKPPYLPTDFSHGG